MKRSMALLAVLSLGMAACSSSDDQTEETPAATEADTAADERAPTDVGSVDEATSPAAAGGDLDLGVDTIKIGFIGPLSGSLAFFGEFYGNSLRVEIDRVNEAGGVGGAQLELVERDQELNPQLAVQAAQEFSGDDDISMVVGPLLTSFFNAGKGIFEENQMLSCQPGTNADDAIEGLEYTFRVQDIQSEQLPILLEYLSEEGVESLGLVYEDDDAGRGYDQYFTDHAEADFGITYVGFEPTRPDDQTHRPQVEALQDADALFLSNNSTASAKSAVAAQEIDYQGVIAGSTGLMGATYIEGAGEAADGTIVTAYYADGYSRVPQDDWGAAYRDHINDLNEDYGVTSGTEGLEIFKGVPLAGNCITLFTRAVESAGSLESDALVTAWEGLDVPADEMPSNVDAVFGPDDHEAYSADQMWLYQWQHDDEGWHLQPLRGPDGPR